MNFRPLLVYAGFMAFTLSLAAPLYALDTQGDVGSLPQPGAPQPGLGGPKALPPELVPIGEDIEDWQARWELARLLSYTKRYDASLSQYQKLLEEKPQLVQARIEMATVLFWSGKSEEAASILRQVPQQDLSSEAKIALVDIYIAGKEYAKAEELLKKHIQDYPTDDAARLKLAEILSWTKRYDDSLAAYESILQRHPDDVQVRRKYAYVLIWAGRQDQAASELRKSLGE